MGKGKSADATELWMRYEEFGPKDLAVAIAAKMNPSSLATYKSEKRYPRANEIVAIAKFLGTTVEYLVTGKETIYLPADEMSP